MLTPFATASARTFTGGDWVLYVVLPLLLVGLGAALYLRGRSRLAEARRIRAGFGGPPGSSDIGTADGMGLEDNRPAVLEAQRQMLRGGVIVGVGLIWLLVGLLVRLL